MPESTWSEYSKLVLAELERLDNNDKELKKEIAKLRDKVVSGMADLRTEMATQRAKIGFIYGAPSLIIALGSFIYAFMRTR